MLTNWYELIHHCQAKVHVRMKLYSCESTKSYLSKTHAVSCCQSSHLSIFWVPLLGRPLLSMKPGRKHEATSVASSRYHVGMSLFIAHIRVETLHHIQPAVRNQSLNVMCWSPQNQLGAVWRHWNPASDKEFEQWEFCHEWSPVPVAVPRLKNKGKTKSPNGCITTKHRYLIPKKTPTRKTKETKHRNKTKHDLAFPGTLRAFLGEKEIRLEGGPMIFIVVQAVDFHFGLLPPEGGVDLAQGPPNNQKNMPESSSSKIFAPKFPHL